MSRTTEKRVVQHEHDVTTEVRCDLCGRASDAPSSSRPWATEYGDATEVTVSFRTGSSYSDGGLGELTEFDVCPTCWRDKVVPWMRSQGAEPRVTEWDF